MIKQLSINRFKSIQSLSIPCKKVNIFIGEPDTGKTNILDALQMFSCIGWNLPIGNSLRLNQVIGFSDLFYKKFLDKPLVISADDISVGFMLVNNNLKVEHQSQQTYISFNGSINNINFRFIRQYSYISSNQWLYQAIAPFNGNDMIAIPSGQNMLYIARHNEGVYNLLKEVVSDMGFNVHFDESSKRFNFSEVRKGEIIDYNLDLLSDSIKRIFFYNAILLTTQNSTLVLDEPDVCAFPPYPKNLGEMIAGDKTNQFFLTTHNPYFLLALVEKTLKTDLAVFVCNRNKDDGSTYATELNEKQIEKITELGPSVFFSLDELVKK